MSESHQEALASMLYGVQERKGFVLILGEVGTGKTTLIRHILEQFGAHITTAFIFNTINRFEDLLWMMLQDLEIPCERRDPVEMVNVLNMYLMKAAEAGRRVVLILDEAQHLSLEILEELRMLSNLETSHHKLLQIILVGQPELATKLGRPELRQLRQRIPLVAELKPLTRQETRQYIAHRLHIAGFAGKRLFTAGALRKLYRATGGIPRLINVICDQALVTGYSMDAKRIGWRIVHMAVKDFPAFWTHQSPSPKASQTPELPPQLPQAKPTRRRRAVVLLLSVGVVILLFMTLVQQERLGSPRLSHVLAGAQDWWHTLVEHVPFKPEGLRLTATVQGSSSGQRPSDPLDPEPRAAVQNGTPDSDRRLPIAARPTPPAAVLPTQGVDIPSLEPLETRQARPSTAVHGGQDTVTVQPGDSLVGLIRRAYGRVDLTLLDFVKRVNATIDSIDTIEVGQRLQFPPLRPRDMVHEAKPGTYRVHLATVADLQDLHAEMVEARLRKLGQAMHIVPIRLTQDARLWYRIMAGDFADREAAAGFYQSFWRSIRSVPS